MTVDRRLQDRFRLARAANAPPDDDLPPEKVETGGGGGDSGGMDGILAAKVEALSERVDKLDGRMDKLDGRMDKLDDRMREMERTLAGVSAKLDLLTGQLMGKFPTWWQVPATIGATIALLGALYAAARRLQLLP